MDENLKATEEYYEIEDIAKMLQVGISTVYRWVKDKTIPSVKIGRIKIPKQEFEDFLEDHTTVPE